MSTKKPHTDPQHLRERARQILRDHSFEHTLAALDEGDLDLESLLEQLHIYHAELKIQQEALQDSQQTTEATLTRFSGLYQELPIPVLCIDEQGFIQDGNAAAHRLLALNHKLFSHMAIPEHRLFLGSALQRARNEGMSQCHSVRLCSRDGSPLVADLKIIHLDQHISGRSEYICNVVDQTELIEQQDNLLQANQQLQKLALVVEQSPSIVVMTDHSGVIEYVNTRFCTLTGYSSGEVQGRPIARLQAHGLEPDEDPQEEVWQTLKQGRAWEGELCVRKKHGQHYWEQATITPLRDSQGRITHFVKMAEDISDKKALSAQLTFLAHYDPLTELPNRALMRERVDQAMASAHRHEHMMALFAIDVDGLKLVNDSLGHAAGDQLLCGVAQRLRGLLREEDSLARLGGDNFVILCGQISSHQDALAVAERIHGVLEEPFSIDDHNLVATASTGIALYPEDADNTDELLRRADTALHRAKADGEKGGYRFYTTSLNKQLEERFRLEQDLRQGLERNELVVFYQPRVHMGSGRILSLEALVRWNHPEFGLIPPGRFIPVAESTGLILGIGPVVLEKVCEQIHQWQRAGLTTVPVAINLSTQELYKKNLARNIASMVRAADIPPNMLEFEITESTAMRSMGEAITILTQLWEAGFSLSIDDFGTGYASMSYLSNLPVQGLKIDRSFVAQLNRESDSRRPGATIVKAMIGLGHNLDLGVIAEGVEHPAQQTFLLENGCHMGQGFLFSQPLPPSEMESLLRIGAIWPQYHPAPSVIGTG